MTRQKMEKTFGLIHYCILEIGLIALLLLGLWDIVHGLLR
jgi:hypothetical protein